jgi:hypothetical protein
MVMGLYSIITICHIWQPRKAEPEGIHLFAVVEENYTGNKYPGSNDRSFPYLKKGQITELSNRIEEALEKKYKYYF